MSDILKVNLDPIATMAVQEIARRENRSASNAASTMIRAEWQRRIDARREAAKVAESQN